MSHLVGQWQDLSYASYIGVAGALAFTDQIETAKNLVWVFAVLGGGIGVASGI